MSSPTSSPWHHPACLDDDALLAQCRVGRGRTGGPGGQNRNKVETLIELCHEPTGVEAHASERRSQMENRRVALRRLRLALALSFRASVPLGEIGSDLWKSRRLSPPKNPHAGSPASPPPSRPKSRWSSGGSGRVSVNPDHHDFPALLAEALDVLCSSNWDPKHASLRLECSPSQLVKLIRQHPPALVMVNHQRAALKLAPLK